MALRMSAHVQDWTPGALEFCLRLGGPFVKTMSPNVEPIAAILDRHPRTQVILRKYYSLEAQAHLLRHREAGGEQVGGEVYWHFRDLIEWCKARGVPVWAEGLNETGLWNDGEPYNAFTVGFAIAVARWGGRPLGYSFPVGNPPVMEHWNAYLDGLYACQDAGGGLALHQYGWPDVRSDADWLSCRHRKVREVLPDDLKHIPIIVTECGLDKGVAGGVPPGVRPEDGAGWKAAGISPRQYAEQLIWLDHEYDRDNVLGGTIFTVGGYWPSFDVADHPEIADALRHAAGTAGPIPPKEEPMPQQTELHVEIPTPGATVIAGQTIQVKGTASGIDGQGMLTALLAEDTRPGTPQYGEPTRASGIPIASDGRFSFAMTVPASTEIPAPSTLLLSTTEIDFEAWQRGDTGYDAHQHSVPIVIDVVREDTPPASDLADVEQALHELWALAGGFRANQDVPNADYIESRVIRIKKAVGLE